MRSTYLGRWLLSPTGVTKGFLRIEGNVVVEVSEGPAPAESTKALVIPSFVNAHTHVGDSLAYPAPKGSIDEIVAPASSYKQRVLRSFSRDAKINAMREAMLVMRTSGTSHFIDFREEGLEGVRMLREALTPASPAMTVLGRPPSVDATTEDIRALLRDCEGLGMSALRDWPYDFMRGVAGLARAAGKTFSVHASEAVRENLDPILDLHPSFLVHMTKATGDDLERCADAGIPVVACPRSNEFFGIKPDVPRLIDAGIQVALGTDNGMIAPPDMIEEMKAAFRLGGSRRRLNPLEVVNLATVGGRKVLNAAAKITLDTGTASDLLVVAVTGSDPLKELVTAASLKDIQAVVRGGKVGRPEIWST